MSPLAGSVTTHGSCPSSGGLPFTPGFQVSSIPALGTNLRTSGPCLPLARIFSAFRPRLHARAVTHTLPSRSHGCHACQHEQARRQAPHLLAVFIKEMWDLIRFGPRRQRGARSSNGRSPITYFPRGRWDDAVGAAPRPFLLREAVPNP